MLYSQEDKRQAGVIGLWAKEGRTTVKKVNECDSQMNVVESAMLLKSDEEFS